MRRAGMMESVGYRPVRGLGRHGACENAFAYFKGPDPFVSELTRDLFNRGTSCGNRAKGPGRQTSFTCGAPAGAARMP